MMERVSFSKILLILMALALVGCTSKQPVPYFEPERVDLKGQRQKVDNVMIILDASESMKGLYNSMELFEIEKAIVKHFTRTIPDLDLNAGLRTFGHSPKVSVQTTLLVYGIEEYNREILEKSLMAIDRPGGNSPLADALDAVADDLKMSEGKTALFIISDGKGMTRSPLKACQMLHSEFGDTLCIYAIQVGDDPAGGALMKRIGATTPCGGFLTADDLDSAEEMAAFVKVSLLEAIEDTDGDGVEDALDLCPYTPSMVQVDSNGCPLDNDRDGVPNHMDLCVETPANVEVDRNGCPLDSDFDGVADYLDKCPVTRRGVRVDSTGCPVVIGTVTRTEGGTWVYKDIEFGTGSAQFSEKSKPILDEIAVFLQNNPNVRLEIQGHTDNRGSVAFNNRLSEKRAQSVRNYLVDQGVSPDRLTAKGYGPSRPIAPNNTAKGRNQNRRVELKPF